MPKALDWKAPHPVQGMRAAVSVPQSFSVRESIRCERLVLATAALNIRPGTTIARCRSPRRADAPERQRGCFPGGGSVPPASDSRDSSSYPSHTELYAGEGGQMSDPPPNGGAGEWNWEYIDIISARAPA